MRGERISLVAALLLTSPALGYGLIGVDWSWQSLPIDEPFLLNVASFPASVGSTATLSTTFAAALDAWAVQGDAAFQFIDGGNTSQTSWSADGVHVLQWSDSTASGATVASAQSWSLGGGMSDCDVRFYASNGFGSINWSSDPSGGSAFQVDLQQTALHELGHCAGLAHSGDDAAIMYPSQTAGGPAARNLGDDDIAGLQAMYGVAVGTDLTLDLLEAPQVGQAATLQVFGAAPGETVWFVASRAGEGDGPCPDILGGSCLDILAPIRVLGQQSASGAGMAELTITPPPGLALATISLQAVALRGPGAIDTVVSNPVGALVLPAGLGCPSDRVIDCAGACNPTAWVGDGYCDDGTVRPWGDADFLCDTHGWDGGDCTP